MYVIEAKSFLRYVYSSGLYTEFVFVALIFIGKVIMVDDCLLNEPTQYAVIEFSLDLIDF